MKTTESMKREARNIKKTYNLINSQLQKISKKERSFKLLKSGIKVENLQKQKYNRILGTIVCQQLDNLDRMFLEKHQSI